MINRATVLAYFHVFWTNLLCCVIYGLMNWFGMEVVKLPYWQVWCWVQIATTAQAFAIYYFGHRRLG